MTSFNLARIVPTQSVLVFVVAVQLFAAQQPIDMGDPTQVIQAYLRATYARDFVEAYRFIAAEDRRVRDLNRYIQQRGSFNGFTLEVARKVSESVQVSVVKKTGSSNRAQVEIRYKVPDPKKIAPLVLDWDPYRLNSLSAGERGELLKTLDRNKRDGAIAMREGGEQFELAKEAGEWRIFLNWAAGVSIPLRLDLSKSAELDVGLSKNEVIVQPGDLFEISLRIKNPTNQAITVRIGHLVAPVEIADYLDFVQCGFLLPIIIQPGKEQEYFGTYLLRGSIPDGVRQLSLNYEFRILK